MAKPETLEALPIAHTIECAMRISTFGRTALYDEMNRGKLKARKLGRRTVILDEDLRRWLASLPARESDAVNSPPSVGGPSHGR
jgi:hypothetical protein